MFKVTFVANVPEKGTEEFKTWLENTVNELLGMCKKARNYKDFLAISEIMKTYGIINDYEVNNWYRTNEAYYTAIWIGKKKYSNLYYINGQGYVTGHWKTRNNIYKAIANFVKKNGYNISYNESEQRYYLVK